MQSRRSQEFLFSEQSHPPVKRLTPEVAYEKTINFKSSVSIDAVRCIKGTAGVLFSNRVIRQWNDLPAVVNAKMITCFIDGTDRFLVAAGIN